MKKKLLAMLAKKEQRKTELVTKSTTSEDVAELRSISIEMETLNGEIAEIRNMIAETPDEVIPADPGHQDPTPPTGEPQQRSAQIPQGQFSPMGTYQVRTLPDVPGEQRTSDFAPMDYQEICGAPEYRSAYLKRLQGKSLNEIENRAIVAEAEKRAMTTSAGSAGAAVPTTTYDKIIEKLRQTSVLFPLIQATYIPGNVVLPVANAVTAAAWNDEVQSAVYGDDTVLPVSLAGFTLAKYAQLSIATQVMTIDAFEAYIVNQIGNQLAIAVENAILNGLGPTPTGGNKPQPTGILTGVAWDSTNSITYSATGLVYDDFVNLRAKLGTVYRPGSQIVMNSGMEAQLFKIKTTTGKPIFSQDPQNGFIQKILNTPYLVDDYIPDETVLLARLDYYYMNFSQAPVIEADKSAGFGSASILYRGLLIADGKPALSEAFVKMTQAAA